MLHLLLELRLYIDVKKYFYILFTNKFININIIY